MQQQAQKTATFRMSWLRLYAVLGTMTFFGTVVPLGFLLGVQPLLGMGAVFLGQLLFEALFALAMCSAFPTTVSAESLGATTFWGKRLALRWDRIEAAQQRSFLFLPYLVVTSKDGGAPLWVPLFVADRVGFAAALQENAPEDSPIRQAIRL
jgi:hypothetical protein